MKVGNMLAKLAKGETLSLTEIAELRLKLNKQENITNSWAKSMLGTKPSFEGSAEDAFALGDHPYISLSYSGQTISTGVSTLLRLGSTVGKYGVGWAVDNTTPITEINVIDSGLYIITINAVWVNVDTGGRSISITITEPIEGDTGALIVSNVVPAVVGSATAQNFTTILSLRKDSTVNIYAIHDGVGSITINTRFTMCKIRNIPFPATTSNDYIINRTYDVGY